MLDPNGKWRGIAERVSIEMNSEKLMTLVEELCREIDQENQAAMSLSCRSTSSPKLQTCSERRASIADVTRSIL
jgi:hypothetical protein